MKRGLFQVALSKPSALHDSANLRGVSNFVNMCVAELPVNGLNSV